MGREGWDDRSYTPLIYLNEISFLIGAVYGWGWAGAHQRLDQSTHTFQAHVPPGAAVRDTSHLPAGIRGLMKPFLVTVLSESIPAPVSTCLSRVNIMPTDPRINKPNGLMSRSSLRGA